MSGAVSGKFSVKSCGKAHAWCGECRPNQAAAQRRPKRAPKVHTRPCRTCGRCDECLGLVAPEGMKVCRRCGDTKPVEAFTRRADTGGRRNECTDCRNRRLGTTRCANCKVVFLRHNDTRTLCARCRPPVTKPCATCGSQFVGNTELRRYCSPECRDQTAALKRKAARERIRLTALQAYSAEHPFCVCCKESTLLFLAIDHIDGGGYAHRQEVGGGGFYTWLRKNNYPSGFRVLCHNCNMGRQLNHGVCPHNNIVRDS